MKKSISTLLSLVILISAIPVNIAEAYHDAYDDEFYLIDRFLFEYNGTDADVNIPRSVTNFTNTLTTEIIGIEYGCFENNTSITSVTIPDTVISISYSAFEGCTNLQSVTMSANIRDIAYNAFDNTALYNDKSNWENGALYIGNCLIAVDPDYSGEFVFKEGTEVIAAGAFDRCYDVTYLEIPDSVRYIGEDALDHTSFVSSENYHDENGVLYSNGWLIDCRPVDDNIIPSDYTVKAGTKGIAGGAFNYTYEEGLKTITFPESLTTICHGAFKACETLTTVNFPQSLEIIGAYAFSNCPNIKQIEIPPNVHTIDQNAFSYSGVEKISINGVWYIEYDAFYQCENLKTIIMSPSIQILVNSAFNNCNNVEEIYFAGSKTEWENIFTDKAGLYYPYPFYLDTVNVIFTYDEVPSFASVYVPTAINEVTVMHKGTAYSRYILSKRDGTDVARKKVIYYSIDGSPKKSTMTDINGVALIPVKNVTESKDYEIVITGPDIQNIVGTLKVTVEDLKFTSTYEASVVAGARVGLSAGVGAEVSGFEAEASVAEAGVGRSLQRILSLSQEYDENKNNLTITVKQNSAVSLDAKAGLFAGITYEDIAGVETSALELSGKASAGNLVGISLEFDDFSITDIDDAITLGKFIFCAAIEQFGSNVITRFFAEKLAVPINSYERKTTISAEGGAALLVTDIKTNDGSEIGELDLGSKDVKLVISNSTVTGSDDSKTYTNSIITEKGNSLLNFKLKDGAGMATGSSVFNNSSTINDIAVRVKKDSENNITGLDYILTDTKDDSVFWFKDTITTKSVISHSDSNAKNIAYSYSPLKTFTKGLRPFFTFNEWDNVSETILGSNRKAEYNSTVEHVKGIDINISAKIKCLADVGINVGISGIQGYEYNAESGIYDKRNVYIQAENEIEDVVKEKFLGVEELGALALESIAEMVKSLIESAGKVIKDAFDTVVELGQAAVEFVGDAVDSTIEGWKIKISTMIENATPVSILAVEDEMSLYSTSSLATTIGNPYVVAVEDENGNSITDLSEYPLLLTLNYTDEQLAAAGVTNADDLHIMYWDENKCVYVNMGGEHNADTKSLSLETTKTGQYILAVDNCPPAITEFVSGNNGNSPKITAVVSDMSGISEFSFKIDDTELVNMNNLEDYYDFTTGKFEYQTNNLSEGTHIAKIYASDTLGNSIEKDIEIIVSTAAPTIEEVIIPSELYPNSTITAKVPDDNITAVFLNIEYTDDNGDKVKTDLTMKGYSGTYYGYMPELTAGTDIKVWITAYNEYGNSSESEATVCQMTPLSINLTEINDYAVSLTIDNMTGIEDTEIVFAQYDSDGKLISSQIKKIDYSMYFYYNSDCSSFKIFAWNDKMKPLHELVSYEK